jgi:Right handed beta helix region
MLNGTSIDHDSERPAPAYLLCMKFHAPQCRAPYPFVAYALVLASAFAHATTWYVSPTGSDAAAGTKTTPFATFAKAQASVAAGDTAYFRGGLYSYTSATSTCASYTDNVNAIALTKSGSQGKMIHYLAYPGEFPHLDFFGMTDSCRIRGILTSGSWIHLKGFEISRVPQTVKVNHENWGVWNSGSHNIFEQLDIHGISGTGLFIQYGGGNLVLNCDSHGNRDTLTSNGDGQSGDGFGIHPQRATDTGNVLRGCRAWDNSDDGYDCINALQPVLIEDSWAWHMGYIPGTNTSLSAGNGNGFKLGGYGTDTTAFPANPAVHTLRNSLTFANKAAGIYANHHLVACNFYNNTSYANHPDIDMLGINVHGKSTTTGHWRNNVAYSGTLLSNNTFNAADDANNSWTTSGLTLTATDFQSTTYAGTGTQYIAALTAARKSDGSLPDLTFLRPSAASKLIDAGVNVGLPYNGKLPDLGYWETGTPTTTGIQTHSSAMKNPRILGGRMGISIMLAPLVQPEEITVMNGLGKVVASHRITRHDASPALWIPVHESGLYVIRLHNDDRTESGKVVVVR